MAERLITFWRLGLSSDDHLQSVDLYIHFANVKGFSSAADVVMGFPDFRSPSRSLTCKSLS